MLGVCKQFPGVFEDDGWIFKILIIMRVLSSFNIYLCVSEEPGMNIALIETQTAWPLGGEVGVRCRK